jgi:hypothetical protein
MLGVILVIAFVPVVSVHQTRYFATMQFLRLRSSAYPSPSVAIILL